MNKTIKLVQSAIDYIEAHLTEDISVKSVSELSGMSIWQFQRTFRSMVGDSLGNYIRHRRLSLAAHHLIQTDQRILDIAIEYQFGSQEAFTRAFKNYFQKTPNEVRKQKLKLLAQQKPVITEQHINHYNSGIELNPKIIERNETHLIGLEIQLKNIFAQYQNYDQILVPHWKQFLEKTSEIKHIKSNLKFGLLKAKGEELIHDEHIYLTAVEVSHIESIPVGMTSYTLAPQKYAAFTNKGTGDKTSYTINYIYGTWLPQSEYNRADADDFELFDQRYKFFQEDSLSNYYLPIV